MKKKILKIILFFYLLPITFAHAQSKNSNVIRSPLACTQPGYVIAFFNGLDNTPLEAHQSLMHLRSRLRKTYPEKFENARYKDRSISFQLFYNPTEGRLEDVHESGKQKCREAQRIDPKVWKLCQTWLVRKLLGKPISIAASVNPNLPDASDSEYEQQEMNQFLLANIQRMGDPKTQSAGYKATVDRMVRQMTSLLREGNRIVAVSHSQGSLFFNDVYVALDSSLNKEASLKPVYVAPAAYELHNQVNPQDPQYTLTNIDRVIEHVGIVAKVRPPNIDLPNSLREKYDSPNYNGHGFISMYMNKEIPETDTRIQNEIDSYLNKFSVPSDSKEDPKTARLFSIAMAGPGGSAKTELKLEEAYTPDPTKQVTQWMPIDSTRRDSKFGIYEQDGPKNTQTFYVNCGKVLDYFNNEQATKYGVSAIRYWVKLNLQASTPKGDPLDADYYWRGIGDGSVKILFQAKGSYDDFEIKFSEKKRYQWLFLSGRNIYDIYIEQDSKTGKLNLVKSLDPDGFLFTEGMIGPYIIPPNLNPYSIDIDN